MSKKTTRRDVLRMGLGAAAGAMAIGTAGPGGICAEQPAKKASGQQSYKATVPDTLDLAERARLALRGVANTSDPDDDGLFWFGLFWNEKPPFLEHSGCDIECGFKTLDNYFQLRHATACEDYRGREEQLLRFLLSCVEDDGLFWVRYTPKRPWHLGAYSTNQPKRGYTNSHMDLAMPSSTGGLMATLALRNASAEEKGRYDDLLARMARGLDLAAVKRDDYAYFPDCKIGHPMCMPRGGWPHTQEPADEHETGEGTVVAYFGYPIQGLTRWAAQSGDERALDLAARFARFGMKKKFWGHPGDPDKMAGWEQGHVDSHFHARAIFLRGLLEYGLFAGDRNAVDFVRSSYEHIRGWGINRIGFIPTWVNSKRTCMETCLLGDLVWLTATMSETGVGDYWEDADRIIRNHLVEAQILDRTELDRIQALTAASRKDAEEKTDGTVPLTSQTKAQDSSLANQRSFDNVLDRCVGTFLSYLLPTSAVNSRTMSCCEANGCRGLFYAWDAITRCPQPGAARAGYVFAPLGGAGVEEAQVNLLLNRSAPWLDIASRLPHEGQVEIHNKTCRRIAVRLPGWVRPAEARIKVNSVEQPVRLAGRYVTVEGLAPGDRIRLDFPVAEETFQRTAHTRTPEETRYTITVRGNTVTDISPRDPDPLHYRFYRRDHLRTTKRR